jgi:Co/Zn/Cd efflux system component
MLSTFPIVKLDPIATIAFRVVERAIMSATCCHEPRHDEHRNHAGYKKVLWIVLTINIIMFFGELVLGLAAGSVSLQADALDFLGDSANHAISLFVAGMAIRQRARAAFVKGLSMGVFGLWVFGSALWHAAHGTVPEALVMSAVGVAALLANVAALVLLWAYRTGDSNMRSVWLCSRNDVIGNCAVLLAALGVFGTSRGWPDILVALVMAGLAIQGAWVVTRTASHEMAATRA